jgi:hypothetical protein
MNERLAQPATADMLTYENEDLFSSILINNWNIFEEKQVNDAAGSKQNGK